METCCFSLPLLLHKTFVLLGDTNLFFDVSLQRKLGQDLSLAINRIPQTNGGIDLVVELARVNYFMQNVKSYRLKGKSLKFHINNNFAKFLKRTILLEENWMIFRHFSNPATRRVENGAQIWTLVC